VAVGADRRVNPEPAIRPKQWAGTEAPAHSWSPCAELNLASDDGAPARVRRTLRVICAGSDSVAIADAELAVTEVVTNAVLHAGGDGVSISFWSEGSILDVLVSDGGPGFTPLLAPRDVDQIGGRGLSIVDTMAESWGSSICAPSSVWMRFAMPESIAPPPPNLMP
jgi:anti-sigma regulatory factor (Ser/Thr protein kinase)